MSAENPKVPETYAGKIKEIRQEAERFEDLERELSALEANQEGAIKGWEKNIQFIREQIDIFKGDLFAPEEVGDRTTEEIDALYEQMVDTRTAMDSFMATYRAQARLLHLENEYQGESGVKLLDREYVEKTFSAQLAAVAQDYEQNKGSLEAVDLKALEGLRQELGLSEAEFGPALEELLETAHSSLARDLYNQEKEQAAGLGFTAKLGRMIKNMPQRMSVSMATTLGVTKGVGLAAGALGVTGGVAGSLALGASFALPAAALAGGRYAWQKLVVNKRKLAGYETSITEAVTWDESVRDDKQKALAEKYQGNLVDAIRFKKADQLEAKRETREGKQTSSWEDIRLKYVKGEIKDRDKLRAELTARKEQLEKEALELAKKASPDLPAIEVAQKKIQELNDALQVFYFTESSLEIEREVFISRSKGAEQKAAPKVKELVRKEGHIKQYAGYAGYGAVSRAFYKLAENTAWLPWLQKGALAAGGAYAGYKMTGEALEKWRQTEGLTARQKIGLHAARAGGALLGGVAAGLGGGEVLDYTREHLNDYFASQKSGVATPDIEHAPAGDRQTDEMPTEAGDKPVKAGGDAGVVKRAGFAMGEGRAAADTASAGQDTSRAGQEPAGGSSAAEQKGYVDTTKIDIEAKPPLEDLSKIVTDQKFQGASMAEKYTILEAEAKGGKLQHWNDTIQTPEGSSKHDSIWASTRSLLKAHATELGVNKTGADLDKWAETQTANLVKQLGLDEGGSVKDKVFNGAEVVVYKGSDNRLYLQYNEHPETHPGQTAGYLHEHQAATTHEAVPEAKAGSGADLAHSGEAGVMPEAYSGKGFVAPEAAVMPEHVSGGGGSQGAAAESVSSAMSEAKGGSAAGAKAFYDSWSIDKRMAFNHIYKVNNNAFQVHPEVKWHEYLKGFDDVTKQTTNLVKSGKLAGARFGGELYPVQSADGKVHLIEQAKAGKDRWHLYEINSKGKIIQQKAPGENWLAKILPAKVFNGQETARILGFQAGHQAENPVMPEPKVGTTAAELAHKAPHSEAAAAVEAKGQPLSPINIEKFIDAKYRLKEKDWDLAAQAKAWTAPDGKDKFLVFEGESKDMQLAIDKALYDARGKYPAAEVLKQTSKDVGGYFHGRVIVRIPNEAGQAEVAIAPKPAVEPAPPVESAPVVEAPPRIEVLDQNVTDFLNEKESMFMAGLRENDPELLKIKSPNEIGNYIRHVVRESTQNFINNPTPENRRIFLETAQKDAVIAKYGTKAWEQITQAFSLGEENNRGLHQAALESLQKLAGK